MLLTKGVVGPDGRDLKPLLQYDRKWHAHPGFVFYDFNSPLDLDPALQHVCAPCCPHAVALGCRA